MDLAFNARSRRANGGDVDEKSSSSPPKNASSLSFDVEYSSILDSTGGFPDEEDTVDFTTNHKEEKDGE